MADKKPDKFVDEKQQLDEQQKREQEKMQDKSRLADEQNRMVDTQNMRK
ncbi:hypothetical protein [Bhargavaea cecembensis]|nr:hypothetical protein [Bhargavaea cecembensis]